MHQLDTMPDDEVKFLRGYYAEHSLCLQTCRPEEFIDEFRRLARQTCSLRQDEKHINGDPCGFLKKWIDLEHYYEFERNPRITRPDVLRAVVHRLIHLRVIQWKGLKHPPSGEDSDICSSLQEYFGNWQPPVHRLIVRRTYGGAAIPDVHPGKAFLTAHKRSLPRMNATPAVVYRLAPEEQQRFTGEEALEARKTMELPTSSEQQEPSPPPSAPDSGR